MAATGGAIALVVLVMAVLTWLAFSARTAAFEGDDETEGLESAVGRVAGLMAKGVTEIYNPEYIDRGYEQIELKLRSLGADIRRETIE